MPNLNKVMLMGNLTRDPEVKYLPSGTPVCELGMAINRTWSDQSGEKKEEVCYVDLTAFGRQAETLGRYMKKGRPLFVEGRLRYETWETDGQKRSKLKIVVENFQFLGGRDDAPAAGGAPASRDQGYAPAGAPRFDDRAPQVDDDDIPF